MDRLYELILKIDLPNLMAIAGLLWMFYKRLDKKFEKIDEKFEKVYERFDKIEEKFDKIEEKFDSQIREVRTSLNHMEGAFYSKDCCMLKDDDKVKKVE